MVCVKDALPYGAKPGALESSAPGVTSDRCGGHGVHSVPTWSRSVNNRNHMFQIICYFYYVTVTEVKVNNNLSENTRTNPSLT